MPELRETVSVADADGTGWTDLTPGSGIFSTYPNWQPLPGPRRSDFKNAAQFCEAERDFWGEAFAGRYGGGANAFGKCVSQSQ